MNKPINISFQGIKGSYSDFAIEKFKKKYNLNLKKVERDSFEKVFIDVFEKKYLGMIPIENSIAGSVVENYDLFLKYKNIEIIGEINISINHCLLIHKNSNLKNISKVFSHPQALMQCSSYLNSNNIKPISNIDTAYSAKYISENNIYDSYAIASKYAAKIYDLKIICENIQNEKENYTRFLLIKNKNSKYYFENSLLENKKSKFKTTIIFELKSIPAALYKSLGGFATNNINLLKIESRPIPNKNFEYLFYLDFEGNLNEKKIKQALDELNFFSDKIIPLGSYKKI